MEFGNLSKDFNLDLSSMELWDLIKAGRLQPFRKIKSGPIPINMELEQKAAECLVWEKINGPIPEVAKLAAKYIGVGDDQLIVKDDVFLTVKDPAAFERIMEERRQDFLIRAIDPISGDPNYEPMFPTPIQENYKRLQLLKRCIVYDEDFLKECSEELKEKTKGELATDKQEAARLRQEFEDIPKLFEQFEKDVISDFERQSFMKKVYEEAWFRRDHIDAVSCHPTYFRTKAGPIGSPKPDSTGHGKKRVRMQATRESCIMTFAERPCGTWCGPESLKEWL